MAQRPSVVTAEVTSVPDPTEISRVADFVREPFVEEGEDAAAVLAPGSIRRHAFEAARTELDAGAEVPSQKWRRRWSLLLGLDRTLNATTPVLADGTTLNPHQIDALSGTYAALLADAQRRARGGSGSDGDALLLSFEDEDPTELEEPPAQISPSDEDEDDGSTGDDEDGHDHASDDDGPTPDEDDEDGEDGELESIDDQLVELPDAEPELESALYDDLADEDVDEDIDRVALDDPNAHKRFWFEHATGAGKTVAAMGFVEACRTGGILILTHRRNLVDQFQDELRTRGYGERLHKPLLTDADGKDPNGEGGGGGNDILGPVTIETYQWFVRNAGRISGAYTVVICDEAHTALGDKTSAAIRAWTGPIFIGMTATGALIARHVADLFPTQTSRFDLAQAARRGVIAPLRCLRIPPGPGVRTIAKVPLRKGEVDMEFDQDELAKLLDQAPFNLAIADLYKTRFRNTPGVVYTAGVKHAYNVAESFRALGMKAMAVSGETPKRELATILADYDAGEIDVLINAQLLAEGWNSPRATICMHLAPTASKRIYQQRVGRVTRRHPGKEAGVVIDFVHPATANDDPVVTLHSLLDRDVYRGGAIVVGPVRRGRGRRVKVERRVLPVTPDIERRRQVFERELWRIAVEQLDWGEQRVWAALAGAKASPANWRRGRAMLNFDRSGELRRQFLITALERNRSPQLRMRAIQEISLLREAEPFDTAIDFIGQWPRDERREASRTMLQAMADRRIGRRDQATAWIWRLAEYTRDVHEEYAAQRWPATKHLLGLLVNSSGAAHARNARRLVHGARQHDRRLQAALLAAAVAHTPEAEEVLREARTRLARKPGALSRDLLKDFPNGKRRKKRTRKRRGGGGANGEDATTTVATDGTTPDTEATESTAANGGSAENGSGNGNGQNGAGNGGSTRSRRGRSRGGRRRNRGGNGASAEATPQNEATPQATDESVEASAGIESSATPVRDPGVPVASDDAPPTRRRRVRGQKAAAAAADATTPESDGVAPTGSSSDTESAAEDATEPKPAARRTRTRTRKTAAEKAAEAEAVAAPVTEAPAVAPVEAAVPADAATDVPAAEKPVRRTRTRKTAAQKAADAAAEVPVADAAPVESAAEAPAAKPVRATRTRKTAAQKAAEAAAAEAPAASEETLTEKPVRATRTRKTAAQKAAEAAAAETPVASEETPAAKPVRAPRTRKTAAQKAAEAAAMPADVAEAAPSATPAARKPTARKTAAQKAAEAAAADPVEAVPTAKPAARRATTRKTAAQKAAEAAGATSEAAEAAPVRKKPAARKTAAQKAAEAAAAEDAPAKKPAARRTTAAKTTAAVKTTTAAKKPATRKTAAQKAAEAAAETATDAPAKKPAARKTTTAAAKTTTARKTTAAKTVTTAAKKTAARKPAAAKTTATKTAAASKPATRRKVTPKPNEE